VLLYTRPHAHTPIHTPSRPYTHTPQTRHTRMHWITHTSTGWSGEGESGTKRGPREGPREGERANERSGERTCTLGPKVPGPCPMPSPTTKPTATHLVPLVAAPPPRNSRNIAPHPRLLRPSHLFAAAAREYQARCLDECWAPRRPCPHGCRHLPPRAVASSPKLVDFAKAEESQLLRCPGCPAGVTQRLHRVVLVSSTEQVRAHSCVRACVRACVRVRVRMRTGCARANVA
jgi:hypothetical protein